MLHDSQKAQALLDKNLSPLFNDLQEEETENRTSAPSSHDPKHPSPIEVEPTFRFKN
jgi:hypothetical protein